MFQNETTRQTKNVRLLGRALAYGYVTRSVDVIQTQRIFFVVQIIAQFFLFFTMFFSFTISIFKYFHGKFSISKIIFFEKKVSFKKILCPPPIWLQYQMKILSQISFFFLKLLTIFTHKLRN